MVERKDTMVYNSTTRSELFQNFLKSRQPGFTFGTRNKTVFQVLTSPNYQLNSEENKIMQELFDELNTLKMTPGVFFRKKYFKVVEFCAGSKSCAEALCNYFDKLNKFPYSTGWDRRTVRMSIYYDPIIKVRTILKTAYQMQVFSCSLSDYLKNQMDEEKLDLKKNGHMISKNGLEDLIAAYIDGGDSALIETLAQIITSENNTSYLDTHMIRGIFKSSNSKLHKLLGQFLLAARLQEGARQAICENMDCGTHEGFCEVFHVIEENDLMRYSSVHRAVATWIGILDPDHLIRSSNKTFALMKECIEDKNAPQRLLDSNDAVQVLVGLWGLGIYEITDSMKAIAEILRNGTIQQKRVAAFFNRNIQDRDFQRKVANAVITNEDFDIEMAAAIMSTYIQDLHQAAAKAAGKNGYGQPDSAPRRINLQKWFKDEENARKHYDILKNLLTTMKHKSYEFNPFLFPWYYTTLDRSDIIVRMCLIANGLQDKDEMDWLSEHLQELNSQDMSRQKGVYLLLSVPDTPKRRDVLIAALGDKESYTRQAALDIAQKQRFTPAEYTKMCELLRFKSADLRKNIIGLLRKQDDSGLKSSIELLLNDKREEMRLAGLDILLSLDEDSSIRKESAKSVSLFANPSEREQILINQLIGSSPQNSTEDNLYNDEDGITLPKIYAPKSDYPLCKISADELKDLFTKLDDFIDEHKNTEFKNVHGEKVLLGANNYLPIISYSTDPEKRTALLHLWKEFYESEIKAPDRLMAMYLSLMPYAIVNSLMPTGDALKQPYNVYLKSLTEEIFGKPIVNFDATSYKYGRGGNRGGSWAKSGGDFFRDILGPLQQIYCDDDFKRDFGAKVTAYLCCHVPDDKRIGSFEFPIGLGTLQKTMRTTTATPLSIGIITAATDTFALSWTGKEEFKRRFELLINIEALYEYSNNPIYNNHRNLSLKALDYVGACFFGLITEGQMYKSILSSGDLRHNLENLFMLYRTERYPYLKNTISRFRLDDPDLEKYVRDVADRVADSIVSVECMRGDSLTPYSKAVTSIGYVCGTNHLVKLLLAMGKEKLERSDYKAYDSSGSRKVCLSHLISVCHPEPEATAETLRHALKGTSIKEKRLVEVAMYAPQWIDIIEEYLGYDGLKSGCYYFMAHMNDQYSNNEKKFAVIARYTPLEKEELLGGAFDIDWFKEAYDTLGEERFQLLYDAAKYISDGSKHSRARKYADAALGRVSVEELESVISDKRNKDLLMSYALIPLSGKEDMLRRYQFIQKFRKEANNFGSQRKASENQACDMALKNLSINAGYRDVTRLTLAMEMELVKSLKGYFDWYDLGDTFAARIEVSKAGKPEVIIRKGEKILSSVPASLKKNQYIADLKESNKKFRDQYSRTVKMLEQAMEERESYMYSELTELKQNPVIGPVIDNLVYITEDNVCGVTDDLGFVNADGEILTLDADSHLRVAHPFDLYKTNTLGKWQKVFFNRQQQSGFKQPFRQVFRELYIKLDEEIDQPYSRMFAGYQIQPTKTVACLKGRRWICDHETGLNKVFYKDNIVVTMYALADWFSPSDVEAPTLEWVQFTDRKTFKPLTIEEVPEIVYSEAMRDVDLAVSVAHAGGVDPEATHSTIEMRKVIAECNISLFGLKNVKIEGTHALIEGKRGEYSVHLGSGVVHMMGHHQLNVLPVHSQHRGRIFLPFLDEDPKTAEIISKILLFAEDTKIKDPYILDQMQ